jgi:hypothetical protein
MAGPASWPAGGRVLHDGILDDTVVHPAAVEARLDELLARIHQPHVVDARSLGAGPGIELDRMVVHLFDREIRDQDPTRVADPDAVGHAAVARVGHAAADEHHVVAGVRAPADGDVLNVAVDPERAREEVRSGLDEDRRARGQGLHGGLELTLGRNHDGAAAGRRQGRSATRPAWDGRGIRHHRNEQRQARKADDTDLSPRRHDRLRQQARCHGLETAILIFSRTVAPCSHLLHTGARDRVACQSGHHTRRSAHVVHPAGRDS